MPKLKEPTYLYIAPIPLSRFRVKQNRLGNKCPEFTKRAFRSVQITLCGTNPDITKFVKLVLSCVKKIGVCELGLEYGVWGMELNSNLKLALTLQASMALPSMFGIQSQSQCLLLNVDIY